MSDELRDELERVFQAMNPEHTQLSDFVDAARPVVVRRVADAWDEGQKSGMRHADRMRAAYEMGRPELPGPPSPNPYRAKSIETGDEQ